MPTGKQYSPYEIKFICNNYKLHTDKWIADQLSRTERAIITFRTAKLGLVRKIIPVKIKHHKIKQVPIDISRRILFMEFMRCGKKLVGDSRPIIRLSDLIPAFASYENNREVKIL